MRLKPQIAFGQALRHFRRKIKISQEKLSQKSGLDRSYISLLERGLRQPSLTSILQLSKALKISSVNFISEVEALLNEDEKN